MLEKCVYCQQEFPDLDLYSCQDCDEPVCADCLVRGGILIFCPDCYEEFLHEDEDED
jgi:hypothetical protein